MEWNEVYLFCHMYGDDLIWTLTDFLRSYCARKTPTFKNATNLSCLLVNIVSLTWLMRVETWWWLRDTETQRLMIVHIFCQFQLFLLFPPNVFLIGHLQVTAAWGGAGVALRITGDGICEGVLLELVIVTLAQLQGFWMSNHVEGRTSPDWVTLTTNVSCVYGDAV